MSRGFSTALNGRSPRTFSTCRSCGNRRDLVRYSAIEEDFALRAVLARTESVQLGDCIVELQEVGERKGNYRSRLTDALDALCRQKDHFGTVQTNGTGKRE